MMSDAAGPVKFVEGTPESDNFKHAPSGIDAGEHLLADYPSFMGIINSDESFINKCRQLFSTAQARLRHQFASVRPWSEFFDRAYFAYPAGASDAINRMNRNISHFYSNYVIVSLLCSSYILLINPAFSICVVFIVFGYFYVKSKAADIAARGEESDGLIYIGNRGFTSAQLYALIAIFGVLSFYFAGGSSVVFWLALTSIGTTAAHSSMRRPALEESSFEFA